VNSNCKGLVYIHMPNVVIKIHDLKKYFGGLKAVDGVSFELHPSEVVGLVGPNGSGKTTVTNLISGLLRIDSGHVSLGSRTHERILPWQVAALGICRTFQEVRLFPQMTVLDNMLVAVTPREPLASLFSNIDESHAANVENLLTRFNLWEKRHTLANNLSYGQRKLLEIARVLAMSCPVILLDEPFAGLFPSMVEMVKQTVKALRDEGKTILLIEHNMELIREVCDRLIVMDAGKILAQGNPSEVLKKKEVIEAYLGV